MAIQRLNQGTPTSASQIPFYDPTNGQDRRASLDEIADVLQASLTASSDMVTQYSAPLTGSTVTMTPGVDGGSVFLRLAPVGTLAALTIALPSVVADGQHLLVKSTQIITALSFAPAVGHTLSGPPTTLAANGFFTLRFDAVNSVWDRVA